MHCRDGAGCLNCFDKYVLELFYHVLVFAALALSGRDAWGCYPEYNTVLKLYKIRWKLCRVDAGKGQ
jgi:hypothetical protein